MHGAVGGGAADSGFGTHTRRACEGKRDGSGCCVEERVWDKREREKNGKRQREIERGERRSKIEIDREEERKRRGERVKYG